MCVGRGRALPSWPWHHVLKGLALLSANGPAPLWEPAGHRHPRADFCLTGLCSCLGHAVSLRSFAARFQIEKCKPHHTQTLLLFFGYLAIWGTTLYCAHFSYKKMEKGRDTLPSWSGSAGHCRCRDQQGCRGRRRRPGGQARVCGARSPFGGCLTPALGSRD